MNISMKTSLHKNIISLLIVFWGLVLGLWFSFAVSLPSYNENRTITSTGTTMNMSNGCNPYKAGAFYEWSKVYFFLMSETLRPDSYGIFKESYAWVYGYNNVIPNSLQLPFIANIQPKDGSPGLTDTKILITEAKNANLTIASGYTYTRNQPAAEIIVKNHYRLLRSTTPNINYFYTNRAAPTIQKTMSASQNYSNNVTWKTSCYSYYVARCGDGVTDKATGTTDGNGGIQTATEGFLAWNTENNVTPTETCDDGPLNGQPWKCKIDCTWLWGPVVATGWATCTLTASTTTIEAGQSVTLSAWYTSGSNVTFTPSLSGITPPFTYPTWNGTATDTPTTTTTYTMNVAWATGLSGTSCSTTVTVTPPAVHLGCTLTVSPSLVQPNQVVSVGWNVSNGNFFWTYIYANPALWWAWPHWVNANQYNGVSSVQPTQVGDYTFTMMVNNNTEQATCTWVVHVVANVPSACTLTTSAQTIMPGQTALLNASYSNAVLATLTPNITGLNFVFPSRSNAAIAVNPTTTTTYTLNTMWIFWSWAVCTATVNVMNTWVTLTKSLITNVLYHSGELVSFKIDFANNGPSTVNGVVVSDYLPAGLEYVSSQIYGVAPFTSTMGTNGINQFVEYSWFSLTPGQAWYLIVIGRFKWYAYANQTLNNAFLKSDNSPMLYAAALFNAYTPSGNATVVKTSDKPSYFPGEDAKFTIAVTNNWPDAINNVTITDNWPDTSCVTPDAQWISNMPLTMTNTSDPYVWNYNGSLAVGQTIYLYITGHISNTPSCVGSYINNAGIGYLINGTLQTGNAQPLTFNVSTTPSSTMVFEKRLVQYGNNVWDAVKFELLYQNNGTATITNYDIVDYWPGTLNFVAASPMPVTQTPTSGGAILHWIFTTPLAPNWSGKITINGTIK